MRKFFVSMDNLPTAEIRVEKTVFLYGIEIEDSNFVGELKLDN